MFAIEVTYKTTGAVVVLDVHSYAALTLAEVADTTARVVPIDDRAFATVADFGASREVH